MAHIEKFYVIQFSKVKPNASSIACVPHSWVIKRYGNIMAVAHPQEDSGLTEKRIQNGETFDKDWTRFEATVLFESTKYMEAFVWMENYRGIEPVVENTTDNNIGDQSMPQLKEVPLMKETPTKSGILKEPSCVLERIVEKGINKRPKLRKERSISVAHNPASNKKNNRVIDLLTRKHNEQRALQTTMKSYLPKELKHLDIEMTDQEITVKRLNNNGMIGNNTENVAHPSTSFVHVHQNTENIVSDNSELIFLKIESITKNLAMFKDVINHSTKEFSKILKGIELCESNINEIKEVTACASNKKKGKTIGDKKKNAKAIYSDDDDDTFSVSDNGHMNEEHNVQFDLPPEHNPDNSTWTLKHQIASPGIVEIIENSHVFIDKMKLNYHLKTATDCKMLARNLLSEIFTENALSVCSLKGKKSNKVNIRTRPGLDDRALTVLLEFVKNHAQAKKWSGFEQISVSNSLRSRLQSLRPKLKK